MNEVLRVRNAAPGTGPPPGRVRLAAVQMEPRIADVATNLEAHRELAAAARSEGATLIAFPECSLTGYCFGSPAEAREHALDSGHRAYDELKALARELDASLVVGALEREGNGLVNVAAVVEGSGVTARYHKSHLPHLGADCWVTPGSRPFSVHEVRGLRVGLLICYDASFPEATRALALDGADLVLLPTNWPEEALAKADWLPNARAYENVLYFASVNRVGTERGFVFRGRSRICAPSGETLAQGPLDEAAILLADLDPERSRTKRIVRREGYWLDRIADRRTDLYPPLASPGRTRKR